MTTRADIDLKKAAKLFANRFATGASVTKNNQGEDEIHIQGDVADDVSIRVTFLSCLSVTDSEIRMTSQVEDMMLDEDDKKATAVFGGRIGEDQIEVIDEKLKKKAPGT